LGEFAAAAPASFPGKPGTQLSALPKARVSVVGMTLAGSHPWNSVEGLEPTGGVSNYLIGNRNDWHSGIPQYARVRVKGVYDGIDLVFYGHGRDLEYDFVVAPGCDPNQIRLAFDGAGPMRVDSKTGDLMIKTRTGGEMRHVRPRVYQQVGDRKVEVAGGYQVLNNGEAAFRLAAYDRGRALTVDPFVEFTTFLGGSAEDYTTGMAVLGAGYSYVTGLTYSTDFPTTTNIGTPAKTCVNNICPAYIFVTALSPAGAVMNSTLIGGSGTDTATGIAVDDTGVWVTGATNSTDFSTHTGLGFGFWNGFVAQLSPDLGKLNWCVTFGGTGDQYIYQGSNAIALDATHAVYVAGETSSNSFPVSQNFSSTLKAKQGAFGGGSDAFVVKVGPDGYLTSGYSTYLGGSNQDSASGIAVDSVGHAFVTGYTTSKNFPTNAATSHGSLANGGAVAFITELSKDGSKSLYSVLLGGTKSVQHPYPLDQASAIALDAAGEAYVTGTSCTSDFPTNANSFQPKPPSACLPETAGQFYQSAFVAKLNGGGNLLYATYLGGTNGYVNGNSIAIDQQENIYVGGITSTSIFPGAPAVPLNPSAGFLTKFHPELKTIDSTILLGADITNIALYTPLFQLVRSDDSTPTALPQILTAGYRYQSGSSSIATKYLDAFVVKLIYAQP
jgi:Beta-propeller repeat